MRKPINLFDCRLDEKAQNAVLPILASGKLTYGPFVSELEQQLGDHLAGRAVVAMGNLTQAIAMALHLAGILPGDEVVTLALNCLASTSAIQVAGATPLWADIDPETLNIDLQHCESLLTPRTKALIAYHVSGYPADVAAIERFCERHGLTFIEDANCALGAHAGGKKMGTSGRFSVLSFYANRQINAIEGAALVCADPADAKRAQLLRKYGVDTARFRDAEGEIAHNIDVPEIGVSASMTHVSARLACHNLGSLDTRLAAVRDNASQLRDALAGTGIEPVRWNDADAPAFWTFLVRTSKRDALLRHLKEQDIHCSKLHQRNDRYSGFNAPPGDLPGTAAFERDMLALPCGWWLDRDDLRRMIVALRA